MSGIQRSTTSSGIRLVSERMPEARSVTLGVWVGVGSRDEPDRLAGASHFLEHLLFKGTEGRSARELSQAVEARGGWMNAYTSREHTQYELRLPSDEVAFAVDVLTEVVGAPALRPDEVESERQVILEEIAMNDDDPDDTVHTLLVESLFPDHPLGRETLGSIETVEALERDDIAAFHTEHYVGGNVVVAACGPLEHEQLESMVGDWLADRPAPPELARAAPGTDPLPLVVQHRDTEQAHVAMAWRTMHQGDPDRFALSIANHILGGGTSSRLFEEVREARGLAYSVGSGRSLFSDAGVLSVSLGTSHGRIREALEVVDDVVADLRTSGPTQHELEVAQGYLCGTLLLSSEDTGNRTGRLGGIEIAGMELIPLDDVVERLRAVTLEDVGRVLDRVLSGPRTLAVVGPFTESDFSGAA